jgi:predicted permease
MARLKPGTPEEIVRTELAAVSPGVFEATIPPFQPNAQALYAKLRFDLEPGATGQSGFRRTFQNPLTFLLCMVVFVLLLACANLANMMLARATAREHEFAVRASLGASRGRLIRQVLFESLLLTLAGAGLGAAAAPPISRLLVNMLSTSRDPIFLVVDSNWRILAFTIAAGLAATMFFGLAPALRAGRTDARGASASREKLIFRQLLLVLQVTLCMVLLTAALLFSRSFRNLLATNAGFQPQGILVANTFFNARQYPAERRLATFEDLHTRLGAIPGVSGVARSYVIPVSGSTWDRGVRLNPTDAPRGVNLSSISEGYFRVMNTPFLAGRDFNSNDRPSTTPVAIVNQTFAKLFFDGANPVGRTFRLDGPEPPFEIVGLVGDTKYRALAENFTPIAYLAAGQERAPRTTVRYVIRSTGTPQSLIGPVKQVLAAMDPQLSVRFVFLQSQIQESVLRERLMAALTAAFGVLAAMLALTGVFGVTAYVVARRYREFGVRIALGATRSGIVRLVLGELAWILLAGVFLGGALAVAAGTTASSMLYGVKPYDAFTMGIVIALLGGGGLIAGLIPALRASRVAPVEALRTE